MEFQKICAPSLTELFVRQIRNSILTGSLPIGTRMPSERELAQKMQVSRAVINSGFEILEHQGFLEIKPRQGVYVSDYVKNGNLETLTAIMEYNGDYIRESEIRSILEFRRAVEHMATDEIVRNASQEDLDELGRLAENIAKQTTVPDAVEAAFLFQHELAIAGGNMLLPLIYTSFKPITSKLWQKFCVRYGISQVYINTKELYDALLTKDAAAVRAVSDRHLEEILDGKFQLY
jgi:GntR family transcriptional repressor for pyruvate dehydrogenase complex